MTNVKAISQDSFVLYVLSYTSIVHLIPGNYPHRVKARIAKNIISLNFHCDRKTSYVSNLNFNNAK